MHCKGKHGGEFTQIKQFSEWLAKYIMAKQVTHVL